MARTAERPRPDIDHILAWELCDGSIAEVELHQVAVQEWRETPRYHDASWHCIPAGGGFVLLARLTYQPR